MNDIDEIDEGIGLAEYCRQRRPSPATEPQDEPAPKEEPPPEEPLAKQPLDISPLEATILLARRGNKKVLPVLRRALDGAPRALAALWKLGPSGAGELAPARRGKGPLAERNHAAPPRRDARRAGRAEA